MIESLPIAWESVGVGVRYGTVVTASPTVAPCAVNAKKMMVAIMKILLTCILRLRVDLAETPMTRI